MPRRRSSVSAPARWLVGVLVAVLAIATVLLVVLALQSVRPEPVDTLPQPVPTFTRAPMATPSPTGPTTTPGTTPPPPATPPSQGADAAYPRELERFLSIGSAGWWRATAGACGATAPLVERSDDGGQTWEDVTPSYRGIAQVITLDTFAGTEAELVAAMGDACETQALRTFTQGEFWQPYDDVLAASRYIDPADPASVVTPGGTVAAPCAEPQSFRAVSEIVALECDGTAFTLRSDDTWAALPATGVVALSVSDGTVLTASAAEGCGGLAVTRWSGDDLATSTPLGCAVGADPAQPVAVAAVDGTATVWSADRLIRLA